MILLNDQRILDVKADDNQEEIISLRNIHGRIRIDESKSEIGNDSDLFCYARESVAKKLIEVVESLPKEYDLCIKEAYRPLSLQKSFFMDAANFYKSQYPSLSEDEIYKMTCQFVAPLKVAGHVTGGAIDLTLLKDGQTIDMGSRFNETPMEPKNLTYTNSQYISKEAKVHRKILIHAMEKAGFINYPTEWWHWSYGDCYYAYFSGCPACYGPVDENDIKK